MASHPKSSTRSASANTNPHSLVSSGAETHLANAHILAFEYPAMDLLPFGVQLDITRPAQLEHRRKPHPNAIHPSLGSEFFTILKSDQYARSHTELAASPTTSDAVSRLLRGIDNLKGLPGSSCLRIVTFRNPEQPAHASALTYRFQLKRFDDVRSAPTEPLSLSEEDWSILTTLLEMDPWIGIVRDLVLRASERAFFEVRGRLLRSFGTLPHGAAAVANEEAQWDALWLSHEPRTAADLFRARIRPLGPENSQGVISFQLPCTHAFPISRTALGALSFETSLKTRCPTCGARVLQAADMGELKLREDLDDSTTFHDTVAGWRGLDSEAFASNHRREYVFQSDILLSILQHVRDSFTAPLSLSPAALNPQSLYAEEIDAIALHLDATHPGFPTRITISIPALFETLYKLLASAPMFNAHGKMARLGDLPHPPGWEAFVTLWLKRTMNFLLRRRCVLEGWEHGAVHAHGDVLYYHAESMTGEESAMNREMDELVGAFGRGGI